MVLKYLKKPLKNVTKADNCCGQLLRASDFSNVIYSGRTIVLLTKAGALLISNVIWNKTRFKAVFHLFHSLFFPRVAVRILIMQSCFPPKKYNWQKSLQVCVICLFCRLKNSLQTHNFPIIFSFQVPMIKSVNC